MASRLASLLALLVSDCRPRLRRNRRRPARAPSSWARTRATSPPLTRPPRRSRKIPLKTGAPFVVRLSPDRRASTCRAPTRSTSRSWTSAEAPEPRQLHAERRTQARAGRGLRSRSAAQDDGARRPDGDEADRSLGDRRRRSSSSTTCRAQGARAPFRGRPISNRPTTARSCASRPTASSSTCSGTRSSSSTRRR